MLFSDPNFRYRIRSSDDFRSKRKWVTGLNLLASLKNSIFMYRLVEAILTRARFYAVDSSSKALTITDKKKKEKEKVKKKANMKAINPNFFSSH